MILLAYIIGGAIGLVVLLAVAGAVGGVLAKLAQITFSAVVMIGGAALILGGLIVAAAIIWKLHAMATT